MAHTSGRIRFATAGVEPGQAPVSGGEPGAVEASLSIMVGGEAADFEAAKPVLEAVGKTIVHVGPAGSGQTVKAANQLIVAGNIELLAEAIVFLEAYGVDTEAVVAKPAVARPHPSHAHRGGVDMKRGFGIAGANSHVRFGRAA
jgi:3-hydroxyisobutyrate dehydrogenase-like beta-hydroxyacid dehydrogenase